MSGNPFIHDLPKKKTSAGTVIMNILQGIVVLLAMSIISYLFLINPNEVDGESMLPNFKDGEILFSNKVLQLIGDQEFMQSYDYNYKRGDVVIFQKPGFSDFIKRVVALPGDKIVIKDGFVFVNDVKLDENYLPADRRTKNHSFLANGEEKTVPRGHYFLLGDNRDASKDSRFSDIGFVSREHIKGRVFVRIWPFDEMEFIDSAVNEYQFNY